MIVGRLAPTPSGRLHLGNVCAFAAAWLSARADGGRLLLRIEDVDVTRARPEVEQSLRDDLAWLGLTADEEVARQSSRDYAPALARLAPRLYRCQCTRAMREQPLPAGAGCQGHCVDRGHTDGAIRFRLDAGPMTFVDRRWGPQRTDPRTFGDPILVRRDGLVSYNLAVVADDVADGVTDVVRGSDLLEYTAVQIQLWQALGAPPPRWLHAPLVLGADGKKLSKSHGSAHVGAMRDAGATPADVWRVVLPWLGIPGASSLAEALPRWDPAAGPRGPITLPR
ncbi:glutamyl-Q tRNA(Asp) synthetase [Luteitalea sp. TBR-22]|uniref:glutamate--tRNA ligase family protein n=1 Tax=Luteitalea sp. TBR-22 TaxID=2802971 RepID=UPI001AF0C263|nr:glutamate--tRNA ligase family protein [Luteitalea sp. TBR-22]BCS31569.1 glutamyl-Q tRNA(Asp) synthetase [Luteitalea sp. TBR-22]